MQDHIQRHIPLKGASNFRDLGGYVGQAGRHVKWRTLFRSDHLANLESEDLAQLRNLGLKRAFDFRGVQESQAQAYEWPEIKRHSLSIEPTVVQRLQAQHLTGKPLTAADALDAMQTTYRDFVKSDSHRFAQLFEHMLDHPEPLLFHCTAGKDRTGFVCAMVLAALDVPHDAIVDDYLESSRRKPPETLARTLLEYHRIPIDARTLGAMTQIAAVRADYLDTALKTTVEQFGSVAAYLQHCGLDTSRHEALRRSLLA